MQGCIRNSGSFSACSQPAESSGAGVVRNKSRILAAGRLLCVPISSASFVVINVSISQCGAFTACSQSAQRLVFDSVALS
ncbi:hypothetical protein T05_15174 [Trichinella murrelli]|uniref:Uncharacterized protein n=1 Tax=Trichinella murrelli TaxID=144512 RepID=A0A0V0SSX8_9BILA|nr:hypothetical protein T05_15174 [Trichinella murrelli]